MAEVRRHNVDGLKEEFQNDLAGVIPYRHYPYSKVAVLLLYWAEDDFQPSCKEEAGSIRELFRTRLSYDTVTFEIPLKNSYNALEKAVVDFKWPNDSESSLMIIYYPGHGDPDEARGKAVWAAKQSGPPTLDWFDIQPSLEKSQGDVLLIFDCCHASLAAKGRAPGKLELLAASSAGGRTPKPGPFSFTQVLKEELERALDENNGLRVVELHRRITQNDKNMQTPVCFNMRPDPERSILLTPLKLSESNTSTGPLGSFTFTISMFEPPSRRSVQDLGEWIKSTAPKSISSVRIDQILDLSTGIQEFILGEGKAGVKGRFLDSLDDIRKADLLSQLHLLGQETAQATYTPSTPSINANPDTEGSTASGKEPNSIWAFKRIERDVSKLSRTLWTLVSRHSAFQSQTDLEELSHNPVAEHAGVKAAIPMSLLAQEFVEPSESDAISIPSADIYYERLPKEGDQFLLGRKGNKHIIVELIIYPQDRSGISAEMLEKHFRRTCALLAWSKPTYFRILKCIGYTHDPHERRYGLIFAMPSGYAGRISLKAQIENSKRAPLENRYRLAYTLGVALQGFHSVHWVHKGIRSENIQFLLPASGGKEANLSEPWIFGFEQTRKDAASSNLATDYRLDRNIYLPPSRWGKPTKKFSRADDIYGLGVLLLEIGYWTDVLKIDKYGFQKVAKAEDVQAMLIKRASTDLCHVMGTKYSKAVLACLTGRAEGGLDVGNAELNFAAEVVQVLEELQSQ